MPKEPTDIVPPAPAAVAAAAAPSTVWRAGVATDGWKAEAAKAIEAPPLTAGSSHACEPDGGRAGGPPKSASIIIASTERGGDDANANASM